MSLICSAATDVYIIDEIFMLSRNAIVIAALCIFTVAAMEMSVRSMNNDLSWYGRNLPWLEEMNGKRFSMIPTESAEMVLMECIVLYVCCAAVYAHAMD